MLRFLFLVSVLSMIPVAVWQETREIPGTTTLTDPRIEFQTGQSSLRLKRGDIEALIVDNSAVGEQHRAGYNGLAELLHSKRPNNLFVPLYAGLNLEHIHDGTVQENDVLFEPRRAPMELRVIDEFTVELYQPPTPYWKLESATRFQLSPQGLIKVVFECIPRANVFANGYIGLFWASYIHQPESLDIHFLGRRTGSRGEDWVRGVTPRHGVLATHLGAWDSRRFPHDRDFPMALVFSRSEYEYTQPFYFGVSNGMACVMIFDPGDGIRFSQSPSGGGTGNPAWDFQWFISDYKVNQQYGFEMKLLYVPFESREQILELVRSVQKAWSEPGA